MVLLMKQISIIGVKLIDMPCKVIRLPQHGILMCLTWLFVYLNMLYRHALHGRSTGITWYDDYPNMLFCDPCEAH